MFERVKQTWNFLSLLGTFLAQSFRKHFSILPQKSQNMYLVIPILRIKTTEIT